MDNSSRPSLLFICQNLPFPPNGGADIRSYHTLRLLGSKYDVTALCFYRSGIETGFGVQERIERLKEFTSRVEAFPIPQTSSSARLLLDHARSILGGRAYTRWVYESSDFRTRLRQILEGETFDIVHFDSLDLVAYLPEVSHIPRVCAYHNVESQLLARRGAAERGWRGAYMRLQARLTEREERRWAPRLELNTVTSPEDGRTLRSIAPAGRYLVVPNGVDTAAFRPPVGEDHQRRGIVFVGGHTWFPNRDGMEYFAERILPVIRATHPEVPVTWVGRGSAEAIRRFADDGVHLTGYVDDIRPFVHAAQCFIVPLRVGGGTRLKILDAWALGAAVVSTSPGSEGLRVVDGENMLVADGERSFAKAVVRVLEHDEVRTRLGEGGRRTVVEHYDWAVIGRSMLAEYASLTAARG